MSQDIVQSRQPIRGLLMALFVLALLPTCLSVFGMPLSYLGGEGIDPWEIYTAAISIPTSLLSAIGLFYYDRKDEEARLQGIAFNRELEALKQKGMEDEFNAHRK